MSQHSPGVVYSDPDLPALTVACAYCTQMEGPLWRRVRSPGYSYYYRLFLIPADGVVEFQLYKASDVVLAYNESINVIVRPIDSHSRHKFKFCTVERVCRCTVSLTVRYYLCVGI